MKNKNLKIIETERQLLCYLTGNNAEFILEILNSASWLKYIGDRNVKTLDDAKKYIKDKIIKSYKDNGFGLYLMRLKTDNSRVGLSGLVNRESLEDVDIGFALLEKYEGNGYAYEAASAVMNYAKTKLHLKRVVAITTDYNKRSQKLLEKLNMKYDKNIFIEGDEEELMLFGINFD